MTKEQIIFECCDALGISRFPVSNGATESKDFLVAVAFQIGIIETNCTRISKIELAKKIVTSFGFPWSANFESTGGTITKSGLQQIQQVVNLINEGKKL